VILAIHGLKNRKSPRIDGVPAELLKAAEKKRVEIMHWLCNIIWKS